MTEPVGRRLAKAWNPPWWTYDVFVVVLLVVALTAAWTLRPGDSPSWVYWPNGEVAGEGCAFLKATGAPCPQCGMTRSWVYAARGNFVTSFVMSPGGLGLFLWLVVAGGMSTWRLARRDAFAVAAPWQLTAGWALFWMIGLYVIPWVARLFGVNPLP